LTQPYSLIRDVQPAYFLVGVHKWIGAPYLTFGSKSGFYGSMDPNLATEIVHHLKEDIRYGRLRPGSALRQDALAARFGVSRQPVRMAIEVLRASGLVTLRRDRSVEIVGTSAQARRDLIAVRTLIEREALLLAVPRLEQEDILRARHVQEQIEIEKDPKRLEDLDCAFHLALYQPCNNVRLLKLIEDLRREDLRPYHEQPIGSPARAQWSKQHRKLLRACAAGGVADAAAALEVHLATLERT
jgi:DNA-binding GntR family transcriptional regulator